MFGKGRLSSAYATVVGFWAPFGSFLTGLASYALGRAFWSQGAGLAALIGTFLTTRCRFVEHCSSELRLFLAPTYFSCRSLCCCGRRNSADTCRPRSAQRTTHLDNIRSRSSCAHSFFQGSDLRGGISVAVWLCNCGVAAAQPLELGCSRRLCGGGDSEPSDRRSFLRRTEYAVRFLR